MGALVTRGNRGSSNEECDPSISLGPLLVTEGRSLRGLCKQSWTLLAVEEGSESYARYLGRVDYWTSTYGYLL
jgi:hypothetical protein